MTRIENNMCIEKISQYELQKVSAAIFVQLCFFCFYSPAHPYQTQCSYLNKLLLSWKKLWSVTRIAPPSVAAELLLNLQSVEMKLQSVSMDIAPPPAPSAVLLKKCDLVASTLVFLNALITPPLFRQLLSLKTVSAVNKTP